MHASGWMKPAAAAVIVLATSVLFGGPAPAQAPDQTTLAADQAAPAPVEGIIKTGDLAVTGFSGTILATETLPAGVDPIDRTLIDPNGPALRVFDASSLGGPPSGNVVTPPLRLDVPARQIGQVFGMAFDDGIAGGPPNLYVAATSAFGLNIVGAGLAADGKPARLKVGAADATFMEGQFGALSTNSPGAIYKIDGATGAATYISDTAFSGKLNSGPGIGGLAYDPVSKSIFASDLDSGLVHRFGLDFNAAILGQYDHGVAGRRAKGVDPITDDGLKADITAPTFKPDDPATWGFTQPARRVGALAVHNDRLYYAVAEGPEIWSVGLNSGNFSEDARLELTVKAAKPFPITGIAFDGNGRMYLAQRGTLKSPYDYAQFADGGAEVLRYDPESPDDPSTPDLWVPQPATYAVGTADDNRAGDGGVALQYAYKPDGGIDLNACDASVAMSSDALTATTSGVQLNGVDLVRPANAPPTQSAFIDYDQRDDVEGTRGRVGNVITLRRCGPGSSFPPVEDGGAFPPVDGGGGEAFPPVDETPGEPFPPVDETTDEGAGGIVVEKEATAATCSDKGGCAFNINVTNPTAEAIPGPIVISDELTAGAANLGGATIEGAPPAPWTCNAPPKMTCTHPGPIAAGETIPLPLSFKPNGIGQETSLQNCAALVASGGPDNQPIVNVPAPVPVEKNGLRVEKSPLNGTCSPTVGGCEWEVKLTNTTAAPLTGPLIVNEVTFGNSLPMQQQIEEMTLPPGIACAQPGGSNTISCQNPNATIPAGQSISIRLKLKVSGPNAAAPLVENRASVQFNNQEIGTATAGIRLSDTPSPLPADGAAPEPQPPACATIPIDPNAPGPPQNAKLTLAKEPTQTKCSDAGGGCAFKITITNRGPDEFNAPIVIEENVTDQDGAIFGTTNIDDGGQASQQPIFCKKVDTAFRCDSGVVAVKIPVGQSVELPISFKLGAGSAAKEIKNCANLPGEAPVCANIPLVSGTLLRAQKFGGGDTCLPNCTFNIVVKNVGNVPFTGFPSFDDVFTPAGAGAKIEVVDGDYVCSSSPQRFFCVAKTKQTIPPGGIISGRVKVTTARREDSYTNCIDFSPDMPADRSNPERCVTIKETKADQVGPAPKQVPHLAIVKTGVPTCDIKKFCEFGAIITNNSQATYNGPITFTDEVPETTDGGKAQPIPAGVEHFADADWTCSKPTVRSIVCTHKKQTLAPGESVSIKLLVTPGPGWKKNDVVVNCVKIAKPIGNDTGANPADAKSCFGTQLDPFALKINKTGPDSCPPGSLCTFTLSLFNPGPIDHNAPVTFTDGLSGASSMDITSIDPPLPCATQPTSIPFSCTTPGPFPLPFSEPPEPPKEFKITVRIPEGVETFTNCALIVSGSGAPRSEGGAGPQASSCHPVKVAEPEKKPECKGGMILLDEGTCACPAGTKWNGRICDGTGGTNTTSPNDVCPRERPNGTFPNCCPSGTRFDDGVCRPNVVVTPPPPRCPTGMIGDYPNCCPRGMRFDNGVCRPPVVVEPPPPRKCPTGMIGDYPNCCPRGMRFDDGKCRPRVVEPPKTCPTGMVGDYPNCCPRSMRFVDGVCRPRDEDKTEEKCPRSRPVGTPPNCCPRGTTFERGACRPPPVVVDPPPRCPTGTVGDYPNCCPRGSKFENGKCRSRDEGKTEEKCPRSRPVGEPPNCCPRGTKFENGACREPQKCPIGTIGTYPNCKCPLGMTGTPPTCCPPGTRYLDGRCQRPKPTPVPTPNPPPDPAPPPKRECTDGKIGRYPRCHCPANMRFIAGRCRIAPKPTPAPVPTPTNPGPAPKKVCPPGLRGPNCDEIIVN